MKPLPKQAQNQLKTIAESAGVSHEDMLQALINWAYHLPHTSWENMVAKLNENRSPF